MHVTRRLSQQITHLANRHIELHATFLQALAISGQIISEPDTFFHEMQSSADKFSACSIRPINLCPVVMQDVLCAEVGDRHL